MTVLEAVEEETKESTPASTSRSSPSRTRTPSPAPLKRPLSRSSRHTQSLPALPAAAPRGSSPPSAGLSRTQPHSYSAAVLPAREAKEREYGWSSPVAATPEKPKASFGWRDKVEGRVYPRFMQPTSLSAQRTRQRPVFALLASLPNPPHLASAQQQQHQLATPSKP